MSQARRGGLTEPIAAALTSLTENERTLCIYKDHAGEARQRLWAHLSNEPHRCNILSGVDILLGDSSTGEAILVLEIEETACPAKKLLGDVVTLALAEFVTTERDDRHYAINPKTELWICMPAASRGNQPVRNQLALDRLRAGWGTTVPLLRIRLITSEHRDTLKGEVLSALGERFGSGRAVAKPCIDC